MCRSTAIDQFPALQEIDRIARLSDATLRNLLITQCYHELSLALSVRTGLSTNWCTFATWASKQAGQTIRKENLERALKDRVIFSARSEQASTDVAGFARLFGDKRSLKEVKDLVWEALNPARAFDRAGEAVGRGNQKVFEEIGREFARFFSLCLNDDALRMEKIASFCAELRPGDPPEGQRFLRHAFRCYYEALFEGDTKKKAELLFLANIEIGFHEQTRLQPEIAAALNAGLPDLQEFTDRLIKTLFPYGAWLVQLVLLILRLIKSSTQFDEALEKLLAEARKQIRLVLTEHMMTIGFPRGVRLRLGTDLNAEFPASLALLVNPDLCEMLARVDPTPNSVRESGAMDWADLAERLHFIVDMFRCYQERQDLFEPPFAAEQVRAMKEGRMPEVPL